MSDAERLNLTTARGAGNPFLFPGRDAGQPMHTTSYAYGCAPSPTGSATHVHVELLREAPAPVVAGMLGYHPVTPRHWPPKSAPPGSDTPPAARSGRAVTHGETPAPVGRR